MCLPKVSKSLNNNHKTRDTEVPEVIGPPLFNIPLAAVMNPKKKILLSIFSSLEPREVF